MTHSGVHLQITSEDRPSIPHWLGEVALVAQVLTASGVLKSIEEQVRFARARFGTYELIDFVAVLIGYAVSAEPTLQAFYERVEPFASAFMALFGRENLPHRCTLSRYLAALEQPVVEALRAQFLHDLILRTTQTFPPGGLWDRQGQHWLVVDIDGTKKAARQRALPKLADLPEAHRRFDRVCAPGYLGRKRGEVARTRTTVLQAHSHHWLGTFGGPGNGDYRAELARACEAIISYAGWLCMPLSRFLVRLDGLYGTTAVLRPLLLAGLGAIVRWKDYGLLDLPCVAARLKEPPDTQTTHPESGTQRILFDCPAVTIDPSIPPVRVIIATHPTTSTAKPPIGILRDGIVYELFLTTAAEVAFTCTDVLDLYLHRGSFETVLADEDEEQETDRWCSRTTWGQEFWQIMNQWIWNLRLSFGQHIAPSTLCLTAFAPAAEPATLASKKPVTASAPLTSSEPVAASTSLANNEPIATSTALASNEPSAASTALVSSEPVTASVPLASNEPVQYEPPRWAHRSWTSGFAGSDFVLQPDGSLRCPAGHPLLMHERRPERNGSIRVVYGARIVHCRPCPLRGLCQESPTTKKPRQVSAVLWPVQSQPPDHPPFAESPPPEPLAIHPVLWGDWPRSRLRRTFLRTLHTQTVELTFRSLPPEEIRPAPSHEVQTRAARAHWRLSWQQRLARNARPAFSSVLEIKIYGLPAALAQYVQRGGLPAA